MPDNSTIPTPISSGATDNPDAPQTSGDLQDIRQNADGQKIGYDPAQNAWVDTTTRKPYVSSQATPTSSTTLPRQTVGAQDMVRNPQTGQTLVYDQSQNVWVDLTTRKPYVSTNASQGGAGGSWVEDKIAQQNNPAAQHGLLRRVWDYANTPIADFVLPQGVKTADLIKATAFEHLYGQAYIPGINDFDTKSAVHFGDGKKDKGDSPTKAYIKSFLNGVAKDASSTAASFTSPLSLATIGAGEAAQAPGAVGKVAKAVGPLAGTAFAGQGAHEVYMGAKDVAQHGLTAENASQIAGGLGETALGGAGVTHVFSPEAGRVVPVEDTASTNPIEKAVTKGVAKSGVTEGEPAENPITIQHQIDMQDLAQRALRDRVNKVAAQDGLQPIPEETSIRDLGKNIGDQYYARSKAGFAAVKNVTGIDVNVLKDKISALNDKILDAADDPERAGILEQKRLALENDAANAFEQARLKGVDVDKPQADWKKYNAAYDFGNQVRMSTSGRAGGSGGEIIDTGKLSPRLQKLYDANSPTQAGRLQQLMGDSTATELLHHMEDLKDAQQFIKDYVPDSATGKYALEDLVRRNTSGKSSMLRLGKSVGVTDWNGALKDFEKMTPEQQDATFAADATRVRQYLGKQALKQNALKVLKYGAGVGTAEEVVRRGYNAINGESH